MTKIKIKDIIAFNNHPFKVEEDDSLNMLMDSINTSGLINPVIVRKKEKDEIVEDFEKQDIEKLKPLEKVIEKIFKDNFTYKYKKTSLHRSYIQVELNRQLNKKEKSLMLTKVNKDNFKYEIKIVDNKTIIEIFIHEKKFLLEQ